MVGNGDPKIFTDISPQTCGWFRFKLWLDYGLIVEKMLKFLTITLWYFMGKKIVIIMVTIF